MAKLVQPPLQLPEAAPPSAPRTVLGKRTRVERDAPLSLAEATQALAAARAARQVEEAKWAAVQAKLDSLDVRRPRLYDEWERKLRSAGWVEDAAVKAARARLDEHDEVWELLMQEADAVADRADQAGEEEKMAGNAESAAFAAEMAELAAKRKRTSMAAALDAEALDAEAVREEESAAATGKETNWLEERRAEWAREDAAWEEAAAAEDAVIAATIQREVADQSARHGVDYEPMHDPDISDYKTLYLREKSHSDQLSRWLDEAEAESTRFKEWGRDMRDLMYVLDAAVATAAERMGPHGEREYRHATDEQKAEHWARVCALWGVMDE